MVSSGPNSPGTAADDATVGTIAWTAPAQALTINDNGAYAQFVGVATSHYLKLTNYGFAIPTDATVNGIAVMVRRCTEELAGNAHKDSVLKLVQGGAVVGDNNADTATFWPIQAFGIWPGNSNVNYGGSSALWGMAWTPANINAADFGVVLSATCSNATGPDAYVDCIQITVYYTAGSAGAQLTETQIAPAAPYMPLCAEPMIQAYTPKVALTDILQYEVRLGSNGSMGAFRLVVPDPEGILMRQIPYDSRITILMRQGVVERKYTGIIETRDHIRSGRRPGSLLQLDGRGYGIYPLRRNKNATYAAQSIFNILKDPTTGLASVVPEIVFGDYIRNPGVTISTTASKRTVGSVTNECMLRSGTSTMPWTYFICHGQHAFEGGKENLHFREKSYSPSPIVIAEDEVYSSEILHSTKFLQNQVEVEYGAAGASEIRTAAASYSDPYTKLLMDMDGTHNAQVFTDDVAHSLSVFGNARTDNFALSSGLFDGTDDYLTLLDSADWFFNAGNFTVDFWVRFNALPTAGNEMCFYSQWVDVNNYVKFGCINNAGVYSIYFAGVTGGVTKFAYADTKRTITLLTNTWYHIAFVRSGNNFYFFQDGTQVGDTNVDADAWPNIAAVLSVGAIIAIQNLNGWFAEYRVSNTARWTGGVAGTNYFTPSTSAYTADANTILLLQFRGPDASATFYDTETTPKAVTAVNHAQHDFAQGKFGSAGNKFSQALSCDGVGSYITSPDSVDWYFGTGNFCIDFWVKFHNLTNAAVFAGQYVDANNYWKIWKDTLAGNNKLGIYFRTAAGVKASYLMTNNWTPTVGTWYHLAFVRNGIVGVVYIDGVSQALTETTAFAANDVTDLNADLAIGRQNAASYLHGWMDDLRITKGWARYTTDFTPPTSAAEITRTDTPYLYGLTYTYAYAPFLTAAAQADDWGDKWLYRTQGTMKAVSLTIPLNLFIEPNYTLRYVSRVDDRILEVINVTHRGYDRHATTILELGTTL